MQLLSVPLTYNCCFINLHCRTEDGTGAQTIPLRQCKQQEDNGGSSEES